MAEKVYLIDGFNYVFRAYYAIAPLSTSSGFPTNALFGFTRMLLKLITDTSAPHLAVVFDSEEKNFRYDLYADYKANREECPDDLRLQMPFFQEVARSLGIPVFAAPGYEADDVIGTLARRLSSDGVEVVIVSTDKDLFQLIDKNVYLWDTMRDKRYRAPEVKEKLGVGPDKVIEFLGLTGDSSDNIPGLSGVGPKTAVQLLEKYGDIEGIINSVGFIRADSSIRNRTKICDQIESDPEILRLSRKLATIDTNVPLSISASNGGGKMNVQGLSGEELLSALVLGEPRAEELRGVIAKLEFSSLFKEFNFDPAGNERPENTAQYITIWKDDFPLWIKDLAQQTEFALDLETTSLDVHQAKIVGLAFCWGDDEAYYIPVGHADFKDKQISLEEALEGLAPILRNPSVKKYGQNLKYDISILACHGIEVVNIAFDTMIASYLLNPDRSSHSLGSLSREFLGLRASEYDEVVGDNDNFSLVDIPTATKYAAEDAHFAWLLTKKLSALVEEQALDRVMRDIEMPLVSVLSRMELRGVQLDMELLQRMSEDFEGRLKTLQEQIFAAAGGEFNVNSPKQLADVLFERLKISTKGVKKTKTGLSTDSSVLEKLSDIHPVPGLILEYRMLHKLRSTYIDALPAQVSPITGRLHTRFNQSVTGTGRLSSSDPNLQNIPIQSEEGREIRRAFIAGEGKRIISADYSQIELRVLAHMSKDKNLIQAFKSDQDIHSQTTRQILGLAKDAPVDEAQRRIGKTINFGVIYGMGGFRLSRELKIPLPMANKYIEEYFTVYSGVNSYFEELESNALENGYVATLFGRRRVIANVDSSGRDAGFFRRIAINAPIQGTAADIIKLAMVRIDERVRNEKLPLSMILQIHDELVFECPESYVEQGLALVRSEMEQVIVLDVPLKVDIRGGKNWREAH